MVRRAWLVAAGLILAGTARAGQVIDMPAPKPAPPPSATEPAAEAVEVGDVALARYARARSAPLVTSPGWGGPPLGRRYVGNYPYRHPFARFRGRHPWGWGHPWRFGYPRGWGFAWHGPVVVVVHH